MAAQARRVAAAVTVLVAIEIVAGCIGTPEGVDRRRARPGRRGRSAAASRASPHAAITNSAASFSFATPRLSGSPSRLFAGLTTLSTGSVSSSASGAEPGLDEASVGAGDELGERRGEGIIGGRTRVCLADSYLRELPLFGSLATLG